MLWEVPLLHNLPHQAPQYKTLLRLLHEDPLMLLLPALIQTCSQMVRRKRDCQTKRRRLLHSIRTNKAHHHQCQCLPLTAIHRLKPQLLQHQQWWQAKLRRVRLGQHQQCKQCLNNKLLRLVQLSHLLPVDHLKACHPDLHLLLLLLSNLPELGLVLVVLCSSSSSMPLRRLQTRNSSNKQLLKQRVQVQPSLLYLRVMWVSS